MTRTTGLLVAGVALGVAGCRHCERQASRPADRDCLTSGAPGDARLAAMPACDPVTTGFGQPAMAFGDGAVVGTVPGAIGPGSGTPFPVRPDNELPFPQTIPNPRVPMTPPTASIGR